MDLLLRFSRVKGQPTKRQPVQWGATKTEIEGLLVASTDRPTQWQLVGERRDLRADGTIAARLEVSINLVAGDPLEVQADSGVWIRGRVEYTLPHGYYCRVYGSPQSETLESISQRGAPVRQVRS